MIPSQPIDIQVLVLRYGSPKMTADDGINTAHLIDPCSGVKCALVQNNDDDGIIHRVGKHDWRLSAHHVKKDGDGNNYMKSRDGLGRSLWVT